MNRLLVLKSLRILFLCNQLLQPPLLLQQLRLLIGRFRLVRHDVYRVPGAYRRVVGVQTFGIGDFIQRLVDRQRDYVLRLVDVVVARVDVVVTRVNLRLLGIIMVATVARKGDGVMVGVIRGVVVVARDVVKVAVVGLRLPW